MIHSKGRAAIVESINVQYSDRSIGFVQSASVLKFDSCQPRGSVGYAAQVPVDKLGVLDIVFNDCATDTCALQCDRLRNCDPACPRKRSARKRDGVTI